MFFSNGVIYGGLSMEGNSCFSRMGFSHFSSICPAVHVGDRSTDSENAEKLVHFQLTYEADSFDYKKQGKTVKLIPKSRSGGSIWYVCIFIICR